MSTEFYLEDLRIGASLKNYNNSIIQHLQEYNPAGPVLDFGAGIGTLSRLIRERMSLEVTCVETEETCLAALHSQGFEVFRDLNDVDKKFNLIFSSNVLEHIESDDVVLRALCTKLNRSGLIFLYLPAAQSLWSEFDSRVGHFRRYEVQDLLALCSAAELEVLDIKKVETLGYFLGRIATFRGKDPTLSSGYSQALRAYDRLGVPLSKLLDKCFRYRLPGKNILCVARRVDGKA